jgi:hypothetical protein
MKIIKEMQSHDMKYKVAILQRDDGLFEIETSRWEEEEDPLMGLLNIGFLSIEKIP